MKHAEVEALRSTCYRRSVGAILVADNRIISSGYNGPASGEPHCTGKNCPSSAGCHRAVHAEVNAFERLSSWDRRRTSGKALYVTESPCPDCAAIIIKEKVEKIFYLNQYRLVEGIDLLVAAGVEVYRMTPGGYTINYLTNELVA